MFSRNGHQANAFPGLEALPGQVRQDDRNRLVIIDVKSKGARQAVERIDTLKAAASEMDYGQLFRPALQNTGDLILGAGRHCEHGSNEKEESDPSHILCFI